MRNTNLLVILFCAGLVFLFSSDRIASAAGGVEYLKGISPSQAGFASFRVSVASNGTQGNSHSDSASISANGRFVAFTSYATNLVPDDTNGVQDVFVHDRQTGQTTRVSVASNGAQADKLSTSPSISADGRFVTFTSYATNLATGTSGYGDIFVHDRLLGETELVSIATGDLLNNKGSDHPSISADGRYVAFVLWFFYDDPIDPIGDDWYGTVFVRDRLAGQTRRVTPMINEWRAAGRNSHTPNISTDGRYVTFMSEMYDLVPGDTNEANDIFEFDLLTGLFTRISVDSDGAQANYGGHSYTPVISADGRLVAFMSAASNLVIGDTNGLPDIFVHDRVTGQTRRVSVAADGTQTSGQAAESRLPSISADGRYVAFQSSASNLVPVDTNNALDVFLYDLQSGDIRLVSTTFDGTQGNKQSMSASVSADGSFVAFGSSANNLVTDDTNNYRDIFVQDGVVHFEVYFPLVMRSIP